MSDNQRTDIPNLVEEGSRFVRTKPSGNTTDDAGEEIDEVGRCRIARRPQMMVSFRKCNGVVDVLPYSMLSRIRSDDTHQLLRLSFPVGEIVIEGDQLTPLFHYLCEHRVLEVVESDRAEAMRTSSDIKVTGITMRFGE